MLTKTKIKELIKLKLNSAELAIHISDEYRLKEFSNPLSERSRTNSAIPRRLSVLSL